MNEAVLWLIDILRLFAWVAPVSLGFALEYSVTRFLNFSATDLAVVILIAISGDHVAVLLPAATGYILLRLLIHVTVVKRVHTLRLKQNESITASLAVSIATISVAGLLFKNTARPVPLLFEEDLEASPLFISPECLTGYLVGGIAVLIVYIFVVWTKSGRCVMLVRSNRLLAAHSGIRVAKVERLSLIVSALAVFAGVWCFGTGQDLAPYDGPKVAVVGLCLALLAKGNLTHVWLIAASFSFLSYFVGQQWKTDAGLVVALGIVTCMIVLRDKRKPWELE